jgi:hypothetical protein
MGIRRVRKSSEISQARIDGVSAENRFTHFQNIIQKIYRLSLLDYSFERAFYLHLQGRSRILKM